MLKVKRPQKVFRTDCKLSTEIWIRTRMTPNTDTFHAVDTHRQKLCFTQFSTRIYWNRSFAASDFLKCLHHQLSSIHCHIVVHFMTLVSFYTLWKHQKTSGFLMFSGGYRKRLVAWNGLKSTDVWKRWFR